MITSRLIYSVFLPLTIWLLYGAPSLLLMGNLAVMVVVVLHLYAVIWVRYVFKLFDGDAFTYGALAFGFNLSSLLTTFVSGFVTLYLHGRAIENVGDIPALAWGVICLGFLVTIAIPVLTTRSVGPLPKQTERREYESPIEKSQ